MQTTNLGQGGDAFWAIFFDHLSRSNVMAQEPKLKDTTAKPPLLPQAPKRKTPTTKKPNPKKQASKKPATKKPNSKKSTSKKPTMAARSAGFIDVLRTTANISRAARESGLSSSTVYRRRATNISFATLWDAALAEALDAVEEVVIDRVRNGVIKPVFYGGKEIGAVRQYSDQLAMFVLKSKRPEIYNRPTTPQDAVQVDYDHMTEAEAEAEFDHKMDQIKARRND
jgi:hypothetical protein